MADTENKGYKFEEKKRLLFLGLPFTFTKYRINDELISVESGFLKKIEDDAYLYKVTDVRLDNSILERMAGLGTITCFGSDVTHPELVIRHVKNSREIKDFIRNQSEQERLRRRTLHTMNLDGQGNAGSGGGTTQNVYM